MSKDNSKNINQTEKDKAPKGKSKSRLGKSKSSSADKQIKSLTEDLQRVQAEFINFKKMTEGEKDQISKYAKAQTIKNLLPVIDDLERALAHHPDDLKDNKWAQGVSKVYERLLQQLERMDVVKIDALNQPFDPNLHTAVQMEGEGDTELVSEVMQNGYLLGDHVIRHAAVKVKSD